jgi:hypothetical protein
MDGSNMKASCKVGCCCSRLALKPDTHAKFNVGQRYIRRPNQDTNWQSYSAYNFASMERKIFWAVFAVLGLMADFLLPFWWACGATIPILFVAWWVAYRSEWF